MTLINLNVLYSYLCILSPQCRIQPNISLIIKIIHTSWFFMNVLHVSTRSDHREAYKSTDLKASQENILEENVFVCSTLCYTLILYSTDFNYCFYVVIPENDFYFSILGHCGSVVMESANTPPPPLPSNPHPKVTCPVLQSHIVVA
jgi:hypothetical protein